MRSCKRTFPDHRLQKRRETEPKKADKSVISFRHLLHLERCDPQPIPISIENDVPAQPFRTTTLLNPLTPSRTCPQTFQEAHSARFGVGEVMAAHDRLDGCGGFVGVVEGNGGHVVVQDVGLDDAVEQGAADEAEFAVNGGGGSAGKIPRFGSVVGD